SSVFIERKSKMFHLNDSKNLTPRRVGLILAVVALILCVSTSSRVPMRLHVATSFPKLLTDPVTHEAVPESDPFGQKLIRQAYENLPLSFEANSGQTDSRIKFLSRGAGNNLFLTSNEAVIEFSNADVSTPPKKLATPSSRSRDRNSRRCYLQATSPQSAVL